MNEKFKIKHPETGFLSAARFQRVLSSIDNSAP